MHVSRRVLAAGLILLCASAALAQVPPPVPTPIPTPAPPLAKTPAALSYDYVTYWAKYVEATKTGQPGNAADYYVQFQMALRRYRIALAAGTITPDQPGCAGCVGVAPIAIDGVVPLEDGILNLQTPNGVAAANPPTNLPAPNSTLMTTLASSSDANTRTVVRRLARLAANSNSFGRQIVITAGTNQPQAPVDAATAATNLGIDPNSNKPDPTPAPSPSYSGVAPQTSNSNTPQGWGPDGTGLGY